MSRHFQILSFFLSVWVGSSFVLFRDVHHSSILHRSFLHKAPLQYCLSLPSVLSETLNLAQLCLNAVSVRDGWRFTLILAGPKIVLLSLTKSPTFSHCMWTVTVNGSCHQRPCPCTKAELFWGHMDPAARSQPSKRKKKKKEKCWCEDEIKILGLKWK